MEGKKKLSKRKLILLSYKNSLKNTKQQKKKNIYQDKKIKMLDFEGEKGKHLPQLVFDEVSKYSKLNLQILNNQHTYFLVSIIGSAVRRVFIRFLVWLLSWFAINVSFSLFMLKFS